MRSESIMNKIGHAINELREMDELAAGSSAIHRLHPLAKLLTTILYIFVTVSYHKYDLSGLIVMVLYPVLLFQLSGLSVGLCFYKLRIVLPLVCAVGLFNPFLDRAPLFYVGTVAVSGGLVSMITLMLKGGLCLMASFLLVATTSMDQICAALRKLHVPAMVVTLLLLTYRYITLMIEEVAVMTEAYHLRAPDQKGIHHSAWGSFLGQLLPRSMDRAGALYSSMQLRGFHGEFFYADIKAAEGRDVLFTAASAALFLLLRFFHVAQILGGLIV